MQGKKVRLGRGALAAAQVCAVLGASLLILCRPGAGLRCSWRKSADSLPAGARNLPSMRSGGAGLKGFGRPAPRMPQPGAKITADLLHGCRVSGKTVFCAFYGETWPAFEPERAFSLPRFGPQCVEGRFCRNAAGPHLHTEKNSRAAGSGRMMLSLRWLPTGVQFLVPQYAL